MPVALLSVYNKAGIDMFARQLLALPGEPWELLASGGTAKALAAADIPVKDVADFVGGKAILGHRVVTLSRQIHAALLARTTPEDIAELEAMGLKPIDLVCVDLYPLEAEIAKPGSTRESVIEQTDIGGPTMLRSAAKGGRIVISRSDQRDEVIHWLRAGKPDEVNFLRRLVGEAEETVARYCLVSARYQSEGACDGVIGRRVREYKYGENGWQTPAALFTTDSGDPLALDQFDCLEGTEPSYNNHLDLDRLLQTITHIAAGWRRNYGRTPRIAVAGKHGNPCGAAVGDQPEGVLQRMVRGDTRAIFGGVVITNFEMTHSCASILRDYQLPPGSKRRILDGVVAPAFAPSALETLRREKGRCRFLRNWALAQLKEDSLDQAPRRRDVRGGFVVQPNYTFVLDFNDPQLVCHGTVTEEQKQDLLLAWAIGSMSNSNNVTIAKNSMLLGNGTGQQDRVGAAELAIHRALEAGHDVAGAVAYSDSFFPFEDGPETLARAGVKAIFATSGSVRDEAVVATCQRLGVALYHYPDALGRGFSNH